MGRVCIFRYKQNIRLTKNHWNSCLLLCADIQKYILHWQLTRVPQNAINMLLEFIYTISNNSHFTTLTCLLNFILQNGVCPNTTFSSNECIWNLLYMEHKNVVWIWLSYSTSISFSSFDCCRAFKVKKTQTLHIRCPWQIINYLWHLIFLNDI